MPWSTSCLVDRVTGAAAFDAAVFIVISAITTSDDPANTRTRG